jgi:pyruvate, orthophosphate dikinase
MSDKINRILSSSDAWQANKSEIPLPPQEYPQKVKELIDAVKGASGLTDRLISFFNEYYHPFPDCKTVTKGYRTFALQESWAFHETENPSYYLLTIGELGLRLLNYSWSLHARERIFGAVLTFIEKELENGYLEDVHGELLILNMTGILVKYPLLFGRCSTKLKKSIRKIKKEKSLNEITKLTYESLFVCYKVWNGANVQRWLSEYSNLPQISEIKEFILSFEHFKPEDKNNINIDDINKLLDYETIANTILQLSRKDFPIVEKIELILTLFDLQPLHYYQSEILNHLTLVLRKASFVENHKEAQQVFSFLFPFFKKLGNEYYVVINSILSHLGKIILPHGNQELIEAFCKNVLTLPFPDPRLNGVNEEWQIIRNPAHLPTIRMYLDIIKSEPFKASMLIAGLHVNLKSGGVFISDTDLFQSDVSDLLNSNIKPVYKQIKQICRMFPVFFKEIGAEGELRTASTTIDELYHRHDRLIHFFRKQIHIESNNSLIDLLRMIVKTWYDGDITRLKDYVPADVYHFLENDNYYIKLAKNTIHIIMQVLGLKKPIELLEQDYEIVLKDCKAGALDIRIAYIIRLYQLLVAKYDLSAAGAKDALLSLRVIEKEKIQKLLELIENEELNGAIDQALVLIQELKEIILNPEISISQEQIYRKRHIAAGIPSMYGRYEERKLECLGATYRLEKLITLLIEKIISQMDLDYMTRPSLRKIHWILSRFITMLEIEGISVHSLKSHSKMLGSAVTREGFSVGQFLNIFQVFSQQVRSITQRYFYEFHKNAMNIIGESIDDDEEKITKWSESVMREILSSALGLNQLDSFLGKIIGTLVDMRMKLKPEIINLVLSFDAERAIVRLNNVPVDMRNAIWLGNKGYNLALLKYFGIKVPHGFVITTEVYRCREAIEEYQYVKASFRRRLEKEMKVLEDTSGLRLGRSRKGKPPLLLSVRSGAAVSMPGVMMTFLNVGMNEKIAKELDQLPNFAWTAWDCYRRMIQLWGMAHGINRDEFDDIINVMKKKHGITKKLEFSPANIMQISKEYMRLLNSRNVFIPENPFEQVIDAIDLVFKSWESPMADVYRSQFDLAGEWGTAVLVQRMILGNLNHDSGTGVAMTKIKGHELKLYGDFVPNSQGEDVVSGLVYPYPISKREQKKRNERISLEKDFNVHFNTLKKLGELLVFENDFPNQEIEFTFEDIEPENLYVLQCRNLVSGHGEVLPVFDDEESGQLLSQGVGAGGGAFTGRVVFDRVGIEKLSKEDNDDELILVRPDTVPDDVDMIFKCGGLLTSRGGVTSHAAVTANRLGKVCVVNCKDVVVYESKKLAKVNDITINEGEWISIDGRTGLIYLGKKTIIDGSTSSVVVELT